MNNALTQFTEDPGIKKIFVGLSAVFGSVPGFAILWKGIGTPPSYEFLFGGVIEVMGAMSLLFLWMYRLKIQEMPTEKISFYSALLTGLGLLSLFLYLILLNYCIISHPTNHTVYYPLVLTGEIEALVNKAGGRYRALEEYGYYGVYQATQKSPFLLSITTIMLLTVYQTIFTSFTVAFGLIGFHKKRSNLIS